MESNLSFGKFLRKSRQERLWQLNDLVEASGVTNSVISRIENELGQATLAAAVSLCHGLGLSLSDLVAGLGLKGLVPRMRGAGTLVGEFITIADIENFLMFYRSDFGRAKEFLRHSYALVLEKTSGKTGQDAYYEAANQIGEATRALSNQFIPLTYPTDDITTNHLMDVYLQNGVICLADVGVFIRKVRKQKQGERSMRQIAEKIGVSHGALSRLETGVIERINFAEVIAVDQAIGTEGEILSLCWAAGEFYTGVARNQHRGLDGERPLGWALEEYAVADTLVKLARWHEAKPEIRNHWIQQLRINARGGIS